MVIEKEFRVKKLNIEARKPIVVLLKEDAEELDLRLLDRVILKKKNKEMVAVVDLTEETVKKGEIGVFEEIEKEFKLKGGEMLKVSPAEKPKSVEYIRKKLDGRTLSEHEIKVIISDVANDLLTDIELTSFVTASYINGFRMGETVALTNGIVESGKTLAFKRKPVLDKHCIGGVPGNRTTMLIVPIVAAAGLTIPKTSSRAITAPSGTADTMEVLAQVKLNENRIREVVKRTGGCIVWGGAINIAAADEKLIRVRNPLRLDPEGMLLASIVSKKKAMGSEIVLVDIPIGKGAKIRTRERAYSLASNFVTLGKKLGMNIRCIITSGDHPIGRGIGPALEAREILQILRNEGGSMELREKSLIMAGKLLELSGKVKEGKGKEVAEEILDSGKAYSKMQKIIRAQGGNPNIKPEDIRLGKHVGTVYSKKSGKIFAINNISTSRIARIAGAPRDRGAGIFMRVEKGQYIKKGDAVFDIYATGPRKLKTAMELAGTINPIELSLIVLGEYH